MIARADIMYRLVFQDKEGSHKPFVTADAVMVIGRDADCQVRLTEAGISDRHAAIERREQGYFFRDLDSANGIRVNGQAVHEQRLATGDELELGSVRLLFEVVHERPSHRLAFDPLQTAMIVIIVVSILGQVGVLAWILRDPRPRNMPVDASGQSTAQPAAAPADALPASRPPDPPAPTAPAQASAIVAPSSLYRMIRILRVDRADDGTGVTLTISARAQVRERELDAPATAICVQYFVRDTGGRPVVGNPVWVTIPPWENFSTQAFAVRFPGQASQFAGFVVRTYYRRQLQDVLATAPQLAALAPNPIAP